MHVQPAHRRAAAPASTLDTAPPWPSLVSPACFIRSPLQDKATLAITDDTRIRASLPTLQHLAKNGAKVVVTSHLVSSRRGGGGGGGGGGGACLAALLSAAFTWRAAGGPADATTRHQWPPSSAAAKPRREMMG